MQKTLKSLTKVILIFSMFLSTSILYQRKAKADLFGGDVVVLGQILIQTIQQLAQLKRIFDEARNQVDTIKNIHDGIDTAIGDFKDHFSNFNPTVFTDWKEIGTTIGQVERLYGQVPKSINSKLQKDTDKIFSESIVLNNKAFKASNKVSNLAKRIRRRASQASPKGAQRITAEGVGLMTEVLTESLKTQSQSLKVEAQKLALENKKEKMETELFLSSSKQLKEIIEKKKAFFKTPRFGR